MLVEQRFGSISSSRCPDRPAGKVGTFDKNPGQLLLIIEIVLQNPVFIEAGI